MITVDQSKRPSCEEIIKHPKVCFMIRALRLREMEANVKRKEEDVKVRSEALKSKEALQTTQQEKQRKLEKVQELKKQLDML